jgi:hypothetical protein
VTNADPSVHPPSVSERLRDELRRYLAVSAYLYVCFAAILLYKSAILSSIGEHYLPLGLAAGKALILGKFVLLGEAAGVGTRIGARSLLQRVLRNSVLFLLLLVLLTILEEIIVGLVHGHSLGQAVAALAEHPWPETLASCFLMLLVLIPIVAVTEVSRTLGPGALRKLLLGPSRE